MSQFELLGSNEDETRLLVERTSGWSLPIVGKPIVRVDPVTPKYDITLEALDVGVEHGFRLDIDRTLARSQALAGTLAVAFAMNRSSAPKARALAPALLPAGVEGGATATYPLRDAPADDPIVEQLVVLVRPRPDPTAWVLYHTAQFRTAKLNILQWAHVRGATIDKYHWDPASPRTTLPQVWPLSALALRQGKLELTPRATEEARAKAEELGVLRTEHTDRLIDFFRGIAQTDEGAMAEVSPATLDAYRFALERILPARDAEILHRNVALCKTRHDVRAWAWQCIWAVGNRSSLRASPS